MPGVMNLDSVACARCDDGFEPKAKIVNSNGELFHSGCFVCAQCFRPFPDGVFYEFEGRKYCEHDFHVLFAPCCTKCGEFIIGRVIKVSFETWSVAVSDVMSSGTGQANWSSNHFDYLHIQKIYGSKIHVCS